MNRLAKILLMATSLSPVVGAVAVNQVARGEAWASWVPWLIVAVLLVFVCWALLWHVAKESPLRRLKVQEFEAKDAEALAFLLAYLLPFLSSRELSFTGNWLTCVYVLGLMAMVFAHAGAFHFNPVMGMLGYHFYSVKDEQGASNLLISKVELRRNGQELQVVQLAHGIFLHTRRSNA